jgi:hypothetical protein
VIENGRYPLVKVPVDLLIIAIGRKGQGIESKQDLLYTESGVNRSTGKWLTPSLIFYLYPKNGDPDE